ncbi:MAG: transposase [Kineosporiaceae bacterium]
MRPRDELGKTRRRVAAELIADLERVYARSKAADKELAALVRATGTSLMDLNGIGPTGAARLLVEVGDITRFPSKAHFGSWTGTAPIDASSGDNVHHRLSRKGNRQINRVLHTMATVQLRNPSDGREYFDRRRGEGKTSMEAMRALKRRLSDVVYRTMLNDALKTMATAPVAAPAQVNETGPGGHTGAATGSSATDSHPNAGTSEKSLPGPATKHSTTRRKRQSAARLT